MHKRLIFCYGSLKQGMPNHDFLFGQRYIGVGVTQPRYAMFNLPAGFPALIDDTHPDWPGSGTQIWGELYEVDETCLTAMDRLEGTEEGVYERKIMDLETIHPVRLPHSQEAFMSLEAKIADSYFFLFPLGEARNCGGFWFKNY